MKKRGANIMFTILIAEDEANTRRLLGGLITRLRPDCRVILACDGRDALRQIEQTHVDLVLTDIRMPELDGIGLAKILYESRFRGKVGIISAYDTFAYAQQAIRYQVFAYLLKPIDATALAEVLDKAREDIRDPEEGVVMAEADRYQLCLAYLEEHCAEDLSLSEVAEYFCLSPSYFSSWFREHSGETFVRYLNSLRIRRAREMLRAGSLNIGQIAEAVGFRDTGYFIKVFRQATNVTPAQFRFLAQQSGGGK